jgi:hypothetical protein
MRASKTFLACSVALLALGLSDRAYAAAQLRAGAKTSAAPTSTNPQLRQIQLTFDPDVVPAATTPLDSPYAVTAFRLSVKYDPQYVSVQDVLFVPPFVETGGATGGAATTGTPGQNFVNDPAAGLVSFIQGSASPQNVPAGQDVNIFAMDFVLNRTTNFDTPLTFTIFANPATGDFIQGTNPSQPNDQITTFPAGITPTTLVLTFNQATDQANGTPLPSGAAAGMTTLAGLAAAGVMCRRRRFHIDA